MVLRDSATLSIPTPDGRESISLIADADGKRLVTAAGAPVNRTRFLTLRDRQGAVIFADDPALVRRILRLGPKENGVLPRH